MNRQHRDTDAPLKCVVCRCTDERACDGGCEWVTTAPPLCSRCVEKYLFAKLWAVVFNLETEAESKPEVAAAVRDLRKVYGMVEKQNAYDVPTLREVCAINRRAEKAKA